MQTVLEIDEVEHEVADGVENDVLGQNLRDSHRLIPFAFVLAVGSFGLVAAPQRPFDRLAEVVEVAHQIARRLYELLLIFFDPIFILEPTSIFFLLHGLLELLIEYFLKHALPDVLFLPDPMVVHELGQVPFLELFAVPARASYRYIMRVLFLEINQLARVEDRINNLKVDVFLVDDRRQKILDKLTERLQPFKADDASRLADHFEHLGDFHPRIFLVERKDKFAQFLFRRHNLILLHIRDFFVVNDVLEGLVQFLLRLFHIHHLLHGVV